MLEDKVKNKYKLVSILKLHNRITESQLRPLAKLLVEAAELNKDKKVHKALINALEVLAAVGSKSCDVVEQSKDLQWNAEQPVLEKLFKTVTEPVKQIIERNARCNCDKCKARRSKVNFKSRNVMTDTAARDVSAQFGIKGVTVTEINPNGKDMSEVIAEIATAIGNSIMKKQNQQKEGK